METIKYLVEKKEYDKLVSTILFNSKWNVSDFIKKGNDDVLIYFIEQKVPLAILKLFYSKYQCYYVDLNYELPNHKTPLFSALAFNNFEVADFLLKHHADINFVNEEGENILFFLYGRQLLNPLALTYIINEGIDINYAKPDAASPSSLTFLHRLLIDHNKTLSKTILKNYFIYDPPFILQLINGYKRQTPISSSDFETLLLTEKDHIKKVLINEEMLYHACLTYHLELVSLLFNEEALIQKFFSKPNHHQLLFDLYHHHSYDLIKFLIDQGANINVKNSHKETLLTLAIQARQTEFIQYLVWQGADINLRDPQKKPWINQVILEWQDPSMIQFFLEHGVDLYLSDQLYQDILEHKEALGTDPAVLERLQSYLTKHQDLKKSTLLTACETHNESVIRHLVNPPMQRTDDSYLGEALNFACRQGQLELLEYLLAHHANINYHDYGGKSILLDACEHGQEPVVRFLLNHGASLKDGMISRYDTGKSILMYTCEKGHLDVVKCLVEHGENVNKFDKYKKTALMIACEKGYQPIVEYLVKKHAAINRTDFIGQTAIMYACDKGYTEIVKILLEHKANINKRSDYYKSCLICACENGNHEIVELLLANHAAMNERDYNSMTCLMHAIKNKFVGIAERLIEHNANLNDKDSKGNTALIYACMKNCMEVTKVLLKHEVSVDDQNIVGKTALMYACMNNNPEIVELLLKKGANVNIVDHSYRTALAFACEKNYEKVVKILLDHHSIINNRDEHEKTALMYACERGNTPIVQELIQKGAYINIRDYEGKTPLMYAVIQHHLPLVQCLLDNDANLNDKDQSGKTALIYACEAGARDLIQLLCDRAGPSLDIEENALHTAFVQNHYDIVESLIQYSLKDNPQGKTPLMLACEKGYSLDILRLLFRSSSSHSSSKALIDQQDRQGKTALMYACAARIHPRPHQPHHHDGGKVIVDYLLQAKAQVNLQDKAGNTALMYTCRQAKPEILSLLLDHGGNASLQNREGQTALMQACIHKHYELVKILVDRGVDCHVKDHYGRHALIYAVQSQRLPIIKYLVEHGHSHGHEHEHEHEHEQNQAGPVKEGSDINEKDHTGKSSIHYSLEAKNNEILLYLLRHHGNPHERYANNKTLLMYACEQLHKELIYCLVDDGVNVNAKDDTSKSALHYLCEAKELGLLDYLLQHQGDVNDLNNNHEHLLLYSIKNLWRPNDLIKLLLRNYHAQVDIKDSKGRTALMYACEKQNLEAVQYLVDHGASLEEQDSNGISIWMHALNSNHSGIVNYIREKMGKRVVPFNNKENQRPTPTPTPSLHSENTLVNHYPPVKVTMPLAKSKLGTIPTTPNPKVVKPKPKVLQRYPFQ